MLRYYKLEKTQTHTQVAKWLMYEVCNLIQ